MLSHSKVSVVVNVVWKISLIISASFVLYPNASGVNAYYLFSFESGEGSSSSLDSSSETSSDERTEQLKCLLTNVNFRDVVVDKFGFKCNVSVKTFGCKGFCDSYERGSHEEPNVVYHQPVCLPGETVEKGVWMTECEDGFDEDQKWFIWTEAVTCKCQKCDPDRINCMSLEGKKKRKRRSHTFPSRRLLFQ